MSIAYRLTCAPFDATLLQELGALAAAVFAEPGFDVAWRLNRMPDASAACARTEGGELVGFKLGYAMTETKYYSWLGGVRADMRRGGIAGALMAMQHAWLRERGYAAIETAAAQDNGAMTLVNLRNGFVVCGTRSEPGRLQTILLKSLRA
jgi:GNAT superfamily N-acetyltransferase